MHQTFRERVCPPFIGEHKNITSNFKVEAIEKPQLRVLILYKEIIIQFSG